MLGYIIFLYNFQTNLIYFTTATRLLREYTNSAGKRYFMRIIFFILLMTTSPIESFDKVIIWGHKLHTHTHSYIHNAFYRTFKHMGYQTHWFDDHDDVKNFDFSKSLFLTEGQADKSIPLRDDCRYILHNCTSPKYKPFLHNGRAITLQVYTDDALPRPVTKVDDFIYYDLSDKCIYMPWATDLLPHEIDTIKKEFPRIKKNKEVWWVGTTGDGQFGNNNRLRPFQQACQENGIKIRHAGHISIEDNIKYTQHSYMAPAIVGEWQQKVGYIPCRIFKNISYGQMGITNSKHVHELFKGKIVYNPNTYQLFHDAQTRIKNMHQEELFELMDFVKNKHTYINRIETLLSFLQLIETTHESPSRPNLQTLLNIGC